MDGPLIAATAEAVRKRIAHLILPQGDAPSHLGSIALQSHQRAAVARLEAAIREFGGALLADETGLGKTYVALAIARRATRPLVVAPAALREMWRSASGAARVAVEFTSAEALSRGPHRGPHAPDLVIVDESHHFRNPATARYRALAGLTARAQVLLLSATPVHNAADDLAALLALFLGARAATLDPAWTSRCIVRRSPRDVPTAHLPGVSSPQPLRIDHDERLLDAILSLPPPLPPADGGDGGILLAYSLLRQWASSHAALVEALRRRLARATALLAALEAGRHPTASELAAWSFADGAVQLAFPELVVDEARRSPTAGDLAACVSAHAAAVRSLLGELGRGVDPDLQRAAHIRTLQSKHPRAKIVAFSQFAETVSVLFGHLRGQPGVAMLTADGGRVAGGTLRRAEVLSRFAPHAQGARAPRRADAIDVLLATDLLSEGVNLQDASVVVHLDVPWTPARLDQRVGRVARLGSPHERIAVYAMLPPAGAERIVRVEQRLREKLRAATRSVGVAGTIIPSLVPTELPGHPNAGTDARSGGAAESEQPRATMRSPAEWTETIHALLAGWQTASRDDGERSGARRGTPVCSAGDSPDPTGDARGRVAAVSSVIAGFIALLGDDRGFRLIADTGSGPTEDPSTVVEALAAAGGRGIAVDDQALQSALATLARWRSAHRLHRDLTVEGALHARSRRSVVDRIAAITRRTPRHLRPSIAALAASARRTATARYGAGAERVLGELADAPMPDEAWLRAVSAFGAIHGAAAPGTTDHPIHALLILSRSCPGGECSSGSPGNPPSERSRDRP